MAVINDRFECTFGMGDNVTRDDVYEKAREHADGYYGDVPYLMDVRVERHMTMGGRVSHHMVTVTAVEAK